MKVTDIEALLPLLEDKEFYWVKTFKAKWQPGLWDSKTQNMRLLIGGNKHIKYIHRINLIKLTYKR